MSTHADVSASTLLALLEQELTLLARHQLSSSHQTPDLALDRSGYQLLSRLELGPLSLGGLAEAFKLDVSTVNRQVAALRRKNLVERITDPDGGVAKLLRPTARGLELLRADREVRYGHVGQIVNSWDPADAIRFHELLALFNTSIESLEGAPVAAVVTAPWSPAQIPDLSSKVALVTGANSGLGYWTALHLAARGAHVVMACRSAARAETALAELRAAVPHGSFEIVPLDLADLASVRAAGEAVTRAHDRLDILCNNAGIAMRPRSATADGFESHLGANFLGHFALTAHLAGLVLATPGSRVVHVGSLQHRFGRVRFEDLHFDHRRYRPWNAYGQSKVATLLFMRELERRLRRTRSDAISLASHPGASGTSIFEEMPVIGSPRLRPLAPHIIALFPSPEEASHPGLYAATAPGVRGGEYLGPSGLMEISGPPAPAYLAKAARDDAAAARLWSVAEELTGTRFTLA